MEKHCVRQLSRGPQGHAALKGNFHLHEYLHTNTHMISFSLSEQEH